MDENYEIAYKYFVNRDYENSKQQLERTLIRETQVTTICQTT